jgi:hypothetical protein
LFFIFNKFNQSKPISLFGKHRFIDALALAGFEVVEFFDSLSLLAI